MASEHSSPRREPGELNWFGKTVYAGGTLLRHTATLIDAAAERVSRIASESKQAFDRELDPNIEEAEVIEEYPRSETAEDGTESAD